MASKPSSPDQDDGSNQLVRLNGCFLRILWSLGGFALLLLVWILIVREPTWSYSVRDFFYWGTVLSMLAARQLDVRWYGGRTADGEPATSAHVRRYAALLLVSSAAAWALAQSVDL